MPYWRRPIFWSLLVVGWLVAVCVFGITVVLAVAFTGWPRVSVPGWIIGLAVNGLALASGWEFARQRARPPDTRGFPIEPLSDDD